MDNVHDFNICSINPIYNHTRNRRVTRASEGSRVHRRHGENRALLSRPFDHVYIDTAYLNGRTLQLYGSSNEELMSMFFQADGADISMNNSVPMEREESKT